MRFIRYFPVIAFVLLAACGETSPVGKWQSGSDTAHSLELLKDGTAVFTENGKGVVGKWSPAADNKILIQVNMLGTTGALYAHWDGDDLILEDKPPARLHRASGEEEKVSDASQTSASSTPQPAATDPTTTPPSAPQSVTITAQNPNAVSSPSHQPTIATQPSGNSACGIVLSEAIYKKWSAQRQTTPIGCPVAPDADATVSAKGTTGRWVRLNGGDGNFLIMATNGPHAGIVYHVQGCIYMLYDKLGGTGSALGFPTSDEHDVPGGLQTDFEGGSIYWDRATRQCEERQS